ncbi:hypothetical protein HK105_200554 [Polyrhizophydium stewartii]|uniref:Uncharacterized protein n=1 Tax=Polyrhizophydium stewartii TaxID=2732419 RepID=A0ABR4NJC2_9FUNG
MQDAAGSARGAGAGRRPPDAAPQRRVRRIRLADAGAAVSVAVCELDDPAFGCYTWPSALVLAATVFCGRTQLRGMRVLELGAGTGLAGLVLARLGVASQVVLTDHPALDRVLGNLRDSVRLNGLDGAGVPSAGRADVLVRPLAWGDFATGEMADLVGESGFDVILGADVMYDPKDFEALLATVAFVLERSPPHAVFVTAYQERSSRRSVQALLDKWGLRARQVGPDPLEMRAWLESALQSEMSGALRGGDRAIMLDGLRFEPEDGVPLQAGLDSIFVFEIRRNNAP